MKDTLRVLVSWECNLKCPYCCNEQERFRKDITPTAFEDIDWNGYQNFCVTGGEPLLHMDLVEKVCAMIPAGKTVILYSNGLLFTSEKAAQLKAAGIEYVNIGLHYANSFANVIKKVTEACSGTGLKVRFHARDTYAPDLLFRFPDANFRFWVMDDCDRANEERIVLTNRLTSEPVSV